MTEFAQTEIGRHAARRLALVPRYRPGADSTDPEGKLSSNESAFGPAPAVRDAVRAVADDLHRYRTSGDTAAVLAARLGLDPGHVLVTNGSDELCYLVAQVFLGEGRRAVTSRPAYAVDEIVSRIAGAGVRDVPLRDGAHDLPALARASWDAAVLWLPMPHNPTGTYVDGGELAHLLDAVPTSCLVVLDEAYREFVDPGVVVDTIGLASRHPNVLVQRTLSKDQGLAGLRAGYGVGDPGLIDALAAAQGPFSVNAAALAAVAATAGSDAWRDMVTQQVRRERELLQTLLDDLGVRYHPSQANFVSVAIPGPDLAPHLATWGLTVRDGRDLGMPGWCRISVGLPASMMLVRRAIRAWAEKEGRT